jgi:hypothetical protein
MSREHVWPKWIRDLILPEQQGADLNYTFSDGYQGEYRKLTEQPLFDLQVRKVCEACNSGWMNRTEEGAQGYLPGMLAGKARELSALGQARLAKWGYLKALVAQLACEPGPSVQEQSQSDCRALYALKDEEAVPEFLTVYTAKVGHSEGHGPVGFFRINALGRSDREDEAQFDGYVQAFSVLDFAVLILRMGGEDRAEFVKLGHSPRLTKTIGRIWPPQKSVIWPPGPSLTGAGLNALAGGE